MAEQAINIPGHNILIDHLGETDENRLECECGARLLPECDMSSASIVAEFERHRARVCA